MSESVDGSLRTEKMLNFVEIYNKNETKLTKIPYSFFFFFLVFKIHENHKISNAMESY